MSLKRKLRSIIRDNEKDEYYHRRTKEEKKIIENYIKKKLEEGANDGKHPVEIFFFEEYLDSEKPELFLNWRDFRRFSLRHRIKVRYKSKFGGFKECSKKYADIAVCYI